MHRAAGRATRGCRLRQFYHFLRSSRLMGGERSEQWKGKEWKGREQGQYVQE
jgi:hypothetical protein